MNDSRHNSTDVHMGSQRLWLHAQALNMFKAGGGSSTKRWRWTQGPSLTRKIPPNRHLLTQARFAFSNRLSLGMLTTLQDRLLPAVDANTQWNLVAFL